MKRAPQRVRIGYFGKLPAHGDFIKACGNTALVTLLDQWLAEVMNLLKAEPRWKLLYDAMRPLQFAFVGTRSRCAIAGRIAASSDQSQRRFPFLAMSALDVGEPARFVARSPLALAGLWQRLDSLAGAVGAAADPGPALLALAAGVVDVEPDGAGHDGEFAAFAERHTLSGLDAMLASAGFAGPARQLIMALGLLLQAVRDNGAARLEKSLVLPVPADAARRCLVAAFWLHLIAPFLQQADFELALFFTERQGGAVMVIGFCGADPHTLLAIIDPAAGIERHIDFESMEWVDERVRADARLQQLAACLARPQLSLRSAHELFHETFACAPPEGR
ncbi:type VI secretion system-associated protein TagF [Janthinobacterium fluminis]|uniref:Type VI secretion system-associated protein TagF n=1 Tax=Janthinobacterium fluminis TaxID=2987524 RepID=A0ABT5JV19_9BURK|nr:type VI secretion system-associated protein TagF [Janthinobacterium fluminis]MDC8755998.1 type VI secretion system-associated protein TagF [Janthinobacterium fluminis]